MIKKENIYLNYRELSILIGKEEETTQELIRRELGIEKGEKLKACDRVSLEKIFFPCHSVYEKFHGKNLVDIALEALFKEGLSLSRQEEIIKNLACIKSLDIVGPYAFLKRLIPRDQYIEILEELMYEHRKYYKVPQASYKKALERIEEFKGHLQEA